VAQSTWISLNGKHTTDAHGLKMHSASKVGYIGCSRLNFDVYGMFKRPARQLVLLDSDEP
jgi:hypothetical protein